MTRTLSRGYSPKLLTILCFLAMSRAQIFDPLIIMQSAPQTAQFTSDYSAEWITYADQAGQLKLRMNLTI